MTILNIHFEKLRTDYLTSICKEVTRQYKGTLDVKPTSLKLSIEDTELIKKEFFKIKSEGIIKYKSVEDLNIDIKATSGEFMKDKPIYISSNVSGKIVSYNYWCVAILEKFYVCILKGDNRIIHISKLNNVEVIFDSFEKIEFTNP